VNRKQRLTGLLPVLILAVLAGCGQRAPAWQEQYDLGCKYLEDGNYTEAAITFLAAIDIDPKQPQSYAGLADAYVGAGELDKAEKALQDGYEATGDEALKARLDELAAAAEETAMKALAEELKPAVSALEIPFTVDSITLGETGIAAAKASYGGLQYAQSNLMNDNTEDTVYLCYGHGTPIPDGRLENEFGFLFGAPVSGGGMSDIIINESGFTCLGALHVGDAGTAVLALFGLGDVVDRVTGALTCACDNGKTLQWSGSPEDSATLEYTDGNRSVSIRIEDGVIFGISFQVL
jgi:hypothetical protein